MYWEGWMDGKLTNHDGDDDDAYDYVDEYWYASGMGKKPREMV